jgi:hypothetical protein
MEEVLKPPPNREARKTANDREANGGRERERVVAFSILD